MRFVWVILLVAACGGGQTVTGSFTLTDSNVSYSGSACSGTGGYSDIKAGLGVVVHDEAGKTIGTSNLVYDAAGSSQTKCRYTFTVPLTDIATFYDIEVGRRGKLTYSLDEMESRKWIVALTLGG